MLAFPVLIPGCKFLFPGTGREIRNCIPGFREGKGNGIFQREGEGNLRLVFPGIAGNGNSRSPLDDDDDGEYYYFLLLSLSLYI